MPYEREKQKEYQRQWVAKRRLEYFKDKFCVLCNSQDELELDHIEREDKISHSIWDWSEERRLKELEKCQVLCKRCHRLKTNEENSVSDSIISGVLSYYKKGVRGFGARETGKKFGISHFTVLKIVNGRSDMGASNCFENSRG